MNDENAVNQNPDIATVLRHAGLPAGPPREGWLKFYDTEAEWLEARMGGLGASDAAAAAGLNPYKSRLELWMERTRKIPPPDLSANEKVQWGRVLEPVVAGQYGLRTGRKLLDPGRHTMIWHPTIAWMFATLDRIILPIDDRGPGALEIKTTDPRNADDWEEDSPLLPQIQLQAQMKTTGFKWGALACLIGGSQFVYRDYEANPDFQDYLVGCEEEFWDLVKRDIPPEPDASESARIAIQKLYPKDTGKTIDLPAVVADWAAARRRAKEMIEDANRLLLEAENNIKFVMQDATKGLLPDGSGFTYKLQHRKEVVQAACDFRVLREIKA